MNSPNIQPQYGPTNPDPQARAASPVKRFMSVIGLKPEKELYYRELHADVWPSILDRLRKSNVSNYSIHLAEIDGGKYLVSYLEYAGEDYEADMRAIADDPETQRWWKETDPCQFPLDTATPGATWSELEMLFYMP